MKSAQEFTEAVIKRYLDATLYVRRGMTREAYIQLCKEKWDSFEHDPAAERKIIIDFLMPPVLDDHIGSKDSFDYFETYETAELQGGERADVECFALRDVVFRVDNTRGSENLAIVSGLTDAIRKPEFFDTEDTLDQGLFFVGLFDVLGFSDLVNRVGSAGVIETYQKLVHLAILSKSYKSYQRIRIGPNQYTMGTVYVPVKYAYFSDTIILWTQICTPNFYAVSPFVTKCADLICEALNLGLPLRGSISVGEGIMHRPTNTFIGNAITEANRLEKGQKWIGASFCSSFMMSELRAELNEKVVVPAFCDHLKRDLEDAVPYLAVDWISRWKERQYPALEGVLRRLMASAPEKNKEYYQHTIDFSRFANSQESSLRETFLRSRYLRCPDPSKFDAQLCHMATAIIRTTSGEFIDCAVVAFDPGIWPEELKAVFEKSIVFIRLFELETARQYFKERANSLLSVSESFAYHRAIDKASIAYIDVIAQVSPREDVNDEAGEE
jgi:hypothetical protein